MCQCNSTVQDPHTLCSSVSHLTPLGWGGSSHHFHTSFSSSFFLRPPFAGDWIDYIIMTSLSTQPRAMLPLTDCSFLGCAFPPLFFLSGVAAHTHTHIHTRGRKKTSILLNQGQSPQDWHSTIPALFPFLSLLEGGVFLTFLGYEQRHR